MDLVRFNFLRKRKPFVTFASYLIYARYMQAGKNYANSGNLFIFTGLFSEKTEGVCPGYRLKHNLIS